MTDLVSSRLLSGTGLGRTIELQKHLFQNNLVSTRVTNVKPIPAKMRFYRLDSSTFSGISDVSTFINDSLCKCLFQNT